MLIRLFRAACAANDRRRARDTLQGFCEDRVHALRALDEAHRKADRAMREACKLDAEQFRQSFFARRDPVRSGFPEVSAAIFGITAVDRSRPKARTVAEIGPTKYSRTDRTVAPHPRNIPLASVAPIRQAEAA